ncbi:hypothetical protein N9X53_07275 [Mariniblastus sp.]|jgi:hypothetical protein|nr:hypothetical protein [Mariniblastus sp.]MDB2526471.1 hypothetical protein [Mariniblastus sp.]MDB4371084.1 hypothetical protein [Mariniblastus sp.]
MPLTISNRSTEADVRSWLNDNGFVGKTAKFEELELHAIQRPGWVQVFRFCARVKYHPLDNASIESDGDEVADWQEVFGVALDDERERKQSKKTQIWLFNDPIEQKAKLNLISTDFLICKKGQNGELLGTVLFLLVVVAVAILLLSWFQ